MKRATLSDIAREAGVSRSAVARVLLGTGGEQVRVSEATSRRIEAAASQLRYTPNRQAQQLRGVSSKTIGVILDTQNVAVMSQRLFALESAASRQGYRLLVGQTHGQVEALQEYAADFTGRAVEAVLCLFDLVPGRDARVRECFHGFRKVVFHARPAWKGGYCVRVDTEAAIDACVDHLVAGGKRNPALALWNCAGDELMERRRNAFLQRLSLHACKGIVWDAGAKTITPSPAILDNGIDFMVRKCRADSIIASNDIWATRFMLKLQAAGKRIPEDVAVIGYDNLDIASVISPALTTIDPSHDDYAAGALRLLLDVAADRRIATNQRTIVVQPKLVIRASA